MRRQICLLASVAATGSLVAGVSIASAAGAPAAKPKKPKPVLLKCHISMATQPPPGSNSVDQPPSQGKQYGPLNCPTGSFGGGVESDTFKVPNSGDTMGSYVQFFHNGTVKGKFDLTPDEGGVTSDSTFTSESWTGTLTVVSGTGAYKGIKAKSGTSVLKCTSPDTVHLTCNEKVKVLIPLPKTKK